MITRLLMFILVVTLAIPVATLTPPGGTSQAPRSETALAAKGNKHRKNAKRKNHQTSTPATTTVTRRVVTRTLRGPLTQTFLSSEPIAIPGGAPGTTKGSAAPYPATIEVSGFANGVITDVDLLLLDLSHPVPEDIDILLVNDDGRQAQVMSDVGRIFRVTNIDLTLDDEAAVELPQTELASGAFRPTNINSAGQEPDAFAAPAPALDSRVALSTFDGANPNGTWRLFVTDDASGDAGDIRGWALRITVEADTATVEETVEEHVPTVIDTAQDTKSSKKGKKRKKGKKGKR